MKEVDISVIMPAYNAATYIAQSIDAVISQNFNGSFELLVADDVSSDTTADIISKYQTMYPDIVQLIENGENLGCSENSRKLCTMARGKYLAFCDSDDVWEDKLKLQKQFDFLENNPQFGMVCSSAKVINSHGGVASDINSCELHFDIIIKQHTDVYNSSIMLRKSLYLRMMNDCQWHVMNKCFFDSVWAWWFTFYSKVWMMGEALISYRSLVER